MLAFAEGRADGCRPDVQVLFPCTHMCTHVHMHTHNAYTHARKCARKARACTCVLEVNKKKMEVNRPIVARASKDEGTAIA